MNKLVHLLVLPLLLSVGLAQADQERLFDIVTISAYSQAEVDNDRIQATLFAEREGSDPAKLADAVNQDIDWALAQLDGVTAIDSSTPAYQTSPLYQQGRITGWRVRQTIRLESADMAAMSQMLGRLQARLGLQAVNFLLSAERRQAVEEGLIKEALANFTARAAMVAAELRRGGYRLVDMQVNTGGSVRPPVPQMAMMRAEAAVAAPRLEGGNTQVRVMVNGTIQLKD